MDQATALYDSIVGLEGIRQLLTDRVKENIYLELKTKKNRSVPELDESDAWQFSRALSGFANSDGGVLVWGIETDKEERASKLKPISAVSDFESRLKKSLLNSVQPFVDDVRLETVQQDDEPTTGYLKVLIPRSEKAPHRALLANREYYRRSTEGFYRMEHFDLEDAFGRRPHPALVLEVHVTPRSGDDPHEEVHFALRNEGRGIAKYVGLMCEFSQDVQVAQVPLTMHNDTRLNRGRPVISYADNTGVIHPVPVTQNIGTATIRRAAKATPLFMSVRWYCEGMSERAFKGTVKSEDIETPG